MDISLVVFREGGERRDFPLPEGKTLIGRQDDCDIRIPISEVSRHHAEITVKGDVAMLNDLDSANGTYVNNRREKAAELQPGDHVIVGPVIFTVCIDGEPANIKPIQTRLPHKNAVMSKSGGTAEDPLAGSDELDPISALEALASSTDQTAVEPLPDDSDE